MFHRHRRQLRSQGFHHLGELLNRQAVAAAMPADQNAESVGLGFSQRGVPLFG